MSMSDLLNYAGKQFHASAVWNGKGWKVTIKHIRSNKSVKMMSASLIAASGQADRAMRSMLSAEECREAGLIKEEEQK